MLTNNAAMNDEPYPSGAKYRKDPLAGATLHWPPGLPGYARVIRSYFSAAYALNDRLNELLFTSLGIETAERERLSSTPFCVLKQLRYGPAANVTADEASLGRLPRFGSGRDAVRSRARTSRFSFATVRRRTESWAISSSSPRCSCCRRSWLCTARIWDLRAKATMSDSTTSRMSPGAMSPAPT